VEHGRKIMARPEKEAAVADLAARLRECGAVIVTDYRGLAVKAMSELRRQLRDAGTQYLVVKNTLMRRAADDAGVGALTQALSGPTAIVFAPGDDAAAAAAKALLAFARQHGLPQVRSVMMAGDLYPASAAKELATMPGRDGVLAMLMTSLEAPVSSLMMTLEAAVGELAAGLEAIATHKESAAA
jgi:large subunit ribosomal protein L10